MNTARNNPPQTLAVIIGRAGSKGLPNKNSLPLAGQALICHTIHDALQSSLVDETIVSTDGHAIAHAARCMGVTVIDRPADLAHDQATVDAAVRHAVLTHDSTAQTIVILYANVPVRPDPLIDRAILTLRETQADSVQSYSPVGKMHPWWMVRLDEFGRVLPCVENSTYRRQDLPPLFIPDGGVIAVTRSSLFSCDPVNPHAFLGTRRHGIVSDGPVVDVDTLDDLRLAHALLAEHAEAAAP